MITLYEAQDLKAFILSSNGRALIMISLGIAQQASSLTTGHCVKDVKHQKENN